MAKIPLTQTERKHLIDILVNIIGIPTVNSRENFIEDCGLQNFLAGKINYEGTTENFAKSLLRLCQTSGDITVNKSALEMLLDHLSDLITGHERDYEFIKDTQNKITSSKNSNYLEKPTQKTSKSPYLLLCFITLIIVSFGSILYIYIYPDSYINKQSFMSPISKLTTLTLPVVDDVQTATAIEANSNNELIDSTNIILSEVNEMDFNRSCTYALPKDAGYELPKLENRSLQYLYGKDTWAVITSDQFEEQSATYKYTVSGGKIRFLVLSPIDTVITNITLEVIDYSTPLPSDKMEFIGLSGCEGLGGGSVDEETFARVDLLPEVRTYILTDGSVQFPYRLTSMDNLSIVVPVVAMASGDYQLKLNVEGINYLGEIFLVSSPQFHWRKFVASSEDLNDIQMIEFR